jgi:hypothetical protein
VIKASWCAVEDGRAAWRIKLGRSSWIGFSQQGKVSVCVNLGLCEFGFGRIWVWVNLGLGEFGFICVTPCAWELAKHRLKVGINNLYSP